MDSVMQGLVAAANQDPRLARVFSTFTASNPSIFLDIDRDKAQALGLDMNDVFVALQSTLGGFYINNFNLFGRIWQVNIEGEAADRSDVSRSGRSISATSAAPTCRCASIADAAHRRRAAGHHALQQLSRDPDQGQPGARRLVGRRAAAMAEVSAKTLPAGYAYEWTGTAYQEVAAAGQTGAILGLAVLFAFLFLVGLYESWIIPIPVLLSVPVGVLGAFLGILDLASVARPLCPDRPRRADRAGGQERHPDRRIRQGAARARHGHPGGGGARARGCGFAR